MIEMKGLSVLGTNITILKMRDDDFISLTDIARYKNSLEPKDVVANRLRLNNTIEYLCLRENLHNIEFKGIEIDPFWKNIGTNAFTLSPKKWINSTNAIGLQSKAGRGGGTYAHKDIAIKFANWISVKFELYLVKDYQRLKGQELKSFEWNVKRLLAKMNYKIHTDAIKENIIPKKITSKQKSLIYADEADIINLALFGITAKQRSDKNLKSSGNIRDYATVEQLLVLANMESLNAEFIRQKITQDKRLELLNNSAIWQMESLIKIDFTKRLDLL